MTGSGINIGVMSDSFNALQGAATDVASGDLPAAGVNVLADDGTTDEGRAMCQLIYDLAPGSPLAFSTANGGEGTFAQHIRDLADPAKGNCKVIVDDVRYFAEPFLSGWRYCPGRYQRGEHPGRDLFFLGRQLLRPQLRECATPQFVTNAAGVQCLNFDASGTTTDLTQRVNDLQLRARSSRFLQWSDPFYTTNGVKDGPGLFS